MAAAVVRAGRVPASISREAVIALAFSSLAVADSCVGAFRVLVRGSCLFTVLRISAEPPAVWSVGPRPAVLAGALTAVATGVAGVACAEIVGTASAFAAAVRGALCVRCGSKKCECEGECEGGFHFCLQVFSFVFALLLFCLLFLDVGVVFLAVVCVCLLYLLLTP
jgi:hypothetical protein